jgi:hypothetical protein
MSVRQNYIQAALDTFESLSKVIGELTEEEVYACLNLEAASRRRRSTIDRLISKAVRLNELKFKNSLKEKYHG